MAIITYFLCLSRYENLNDITDGLIKNSEAFYISDFIKPEVLAFAIAGIILKNEIGPIVSVDSEIESINEDIEDAKDNTLLSLDRLHDCMSLSRLLKSKNEGLTNCFAFMLSDLKLSGFISGSDGYNVMKDIENNIYDLDIKGNDFRIIVYP